MIRVLAISLALVGFTAASAVAEDKVDFAKQIQPILSENCAKCHGEKRASGKLRMHTAAALKEKWDTEKGLIVAGKPEESELYKRLVLPKDDKKRMPKGGEPLAKEKIELIARWIKQGAVLPVIAAVATTPAVPPKAANSAAAPKKEEPKKPAEVPLPKVSPAPKEAIEKLSATGAQVMPLFTDSSLLQVSFAHRGSPAGDAEVAL